MAEVKRKNGRPNTVKAEVEDSDDDSECINSTDNGLEGKEDCTMSTAETDSSSDSDSGDSSSSGVSLSSKKLNQSIDQVVSDTSGSEDSDDSGESNDNSESDEDKSEKDAAGEEEKDKNKKSSPKTGEKRKNSAKKVKIKVEYDEDDINAYVEDDDSNSGLLKPNYSDLDPFDYQLLFGPKVKRRRTEITPKMKKKICQYKEDHPNATSGDIAFYFEKHLHLKIGRTTLWDILKNKDKWLNIVPPEGTTRLRAPKYIEMEKELYSWYSNMKWRNIVVTDEMLRNKAQRFGDKLEEVPNSFKYSAGWLHRFKNRFGIVLKQSPGIKPEKVEPDSSPEPVGASCDEALSSIVEREQSPKNPKPSTSSAPLTLTFDVEQPTQKLTKLNDLLKAYNPSDIFRFLELGLMYRKEPLSVPNTSPEILDPKNCDRVTLALCTNLTGTLKVKPIIIWRHARPNCFGQEFDPEILVHWRSDEKGLMNVAIFTEWIISFDWQMRLQNRKVLLLVDDVVWHKIGIELNNVQLHPLSVTFAYKLLALDSGLSSTFKAMYRKYLLSQYLELSEDNKLLDINIKQAVYLIRDSWRDVKPKIIANCWLRTGIPLQQNQAANSTSPIVPKHDMDEILQDLSKLIRNMPNPHGFRLLSAAEFVVVDSKLETGKILSQEDIINMALQQMGQNPNADASSGGVDTLDKDETTAPPRVSLIEATHGLDNALMFIEQNLASGLFQVDDIDNIRDIMKKLLQQNINRYKEASLISFFVQSQNKEMQPSCSS